MVSEGPAGALPGLAATLDEANRPARGASECLARGSPRWLWARRAFYENHFFYLFSAFLFDFVLVSLISVFFGVLTKFAL